MRRFWRGDGSVSAIASRLLGSPDIYGHEEREALRNRQVKNFLALEMRAVGTPLLLMGDELRRTQQGNNNGYCQDNEISWMDWRLLARNADIHRFVRELNAFRQRREVVVKKERLSLNELLRRAHVQWHGVKLDQPDWSEHSRALAFTLRSLHGGYFLHGILNAYWEPLSFELPASPTEDGQSWRRCMDTALASPDDIRPWAQAPLVAQPTYVVQARSVVVLALARQIPESRSGPTKGNGNQPPVDAGA